MIHQNIQNFILGSLHRTKVTASGGLALLMTFAKDIGLGKQLDLCFSHLKLRQRGYSVSAKVLSFIQMIIKGGDRLSDIDLLRADPGLLSLLRMEGVPRPNTLADLARRFRRVILDIDSTLVESGVRIAERTYEGFRGFNPFLGMVRGGGMSLVAFSVFRPGNAAPQSHNLRLVRKIRRYLRQHLAQVQVLLRSDSAAYNHRLMRFRPGRNAHQAVRQARAYIGEGNEWVVDLDLEKFFDRVNHDILMERIARRATDKRILRLLRRYLQAGVMLNGVVQERYGETPQGGPLSPLLSNILLDELDKEMERQGRKFCRYADDCNIYVQSERAGHRVMDSVERFLAKRLKLKINRDKSAVARPQERAFLGFSFMGGEYRKIRLAPRTVKNLKLIFDSCFFEVPVNE